MAEANYAKFPASFFENDKIQYLDSLENGDSLLVIWIQLYLKAFKKNRSGYLYLTKDIPYTLEMLAHVCGRSQEEMNKAFEIFKELGIIEYSNAIQIKRFWLTNQEVRVSPEYREWRDHVFKRDNYVCQRCFQKGGKLEAHHIKEFANYPELRFVIKNGITLCKQCHRELHKKKTK